MKKSFLLAAALVVLGGSTMLAKTAVVTEQPVLEAQADTVKYKYLIEIYDNNTHELLHIEAGCYDEGIVEYVETLIDLYGGVENVYAMVDEMGEC